MLSIEQIVIILVALFFIFLLLKFFIDWLSRPEEVFHRRGRRRTAREKKIFLTYKIKSKANMKYSKILAKFRREHKRKPSKDDLFKIVITASHHTYPVKGRNSRRWMRGKKGHRGRQKVRKYLLEKNKIVKKYIMR